MYTRDGSGGFNHCSDFPKTPLRGPAIDGHVRCAPSCAAVSEQRPSDVLGALPRRRPHRRSAKRGAPPEVANGNGTKPTAAKTAPTATKTAPTATKTAPTATKTAPRAPKPVAAKLAPPATKPTPPQAPSRATARRPQRLRQPAQPAGVPPTSPGRPAEDQPRGRHVIGTAAQAAAELAEIGLSLSARALRGVIDRLPRP
jgi:hypothetical protein